ncbi:MAG: cell division/cell wall cluster transcriptional repressor MraZ [Chloroflexota bacterium]|nr:cell division/cell wall cluster transcriptional repressor MraZ [Chloroflexota bacterium]
MATVDFTGEYEHRLDDRGRLAIPAGYRPLFEHGGYLLPGPDGQIELYTPEGYNAEKQVRTVGDKLRPSARRLARSFFGRVRRVEIDRQGRILIPPQMRDERGLSGDTTIIGMGDYLEIWNSDAWHSEQSEIDESYAELLQGLADSFESTNQNEESA